MAGEMGEMQETGEAGETAESGRERRGPFVETNPEVSQVVCRNIRALVEVRRRFQRQRHLEDRIADAITGFTGSLPSALLHVLFYGGWFLLNMGLVPAVEPWDPFPFVLLAVIASIEAIFLTTFILISQNRMAAMAEKRAELDLQINLLAEHEVTRLISMVDAISRRLGVDAPDPEVEELKKNVAPEVVMEQIEEAEHDLAA